MAEAQTNEKDKEFRTLSEEERQAFIQRARKELPELRRQTQRAIDNLGRIAEGKRPI